MRVLIVPEMVAALSLVMARGIYLPPMALFDVYTPVDNGDAHVANDALHAFMAAELSPRQREVSSRRFGEGFPSFPCGHVPQGRGASPRGWRAAGLKILAG